MEKGKGGREGRSWAIGRWVIGYFGWSASPISLPREEVIEEGSLTNQCETGLENLSCTWVQSRGFDLQRPQQGCRDEQVRKGGSRLYPLQQLPGSEAPKGKLSFLPGLLSLREEGGG